MIKEFNFKKKKEMEKKLQEAIAQRQSERKTKRSKSEEKEDESDTESERNYWLAEINMKVIEALEHLRFANDELPLLKMRKEQEEKEHQQQKHKGGSGTGSHSHRDKGGEDKKKHKHETSYESSISGPSMDGGGKNSFVYTIGGENKGKKKKNKKGEIPNIPIDVARELGMLKVSHEQAMGAAQVISAKKNYLNIGGSSGGTSIVNGMEVPTVGGPPIAPLSLGPVDGVHELKAKARDTVFRESNPPTIGLEQWAELMQEHGQLPTPERSAQAITEAKKSRKKEKREATKKGRVTKVKYFSGDMAAQALSDEDESSDDEVDLTEEQLDKQTKEKREWDNWKDDHERGSGNRLYRK